MSKCTVAVTPRHAGSAQKKVMYTVCAEWGGGSGWPCLVGNNRPSLLRTVPYLMSTLLPDQLQQRLSAFHNRPYALECGHFETCLVAEVHTV